MAYKIITKTPAGNVSGPKSVPIKRGELLTTKEAATLLNLSVAFFERDRWEGKKNGAGPLIPYVKIGNKAVRYRLQDLQAHIDQNHCGAGG